MIRLWAGLTDSGMCQVHSCTWIFDQICILSVETSWYSPFKQWSRYAQRALCKSGSPNISEVSGMVMWNKGLMAKWMAIVNEEKVLNGFWNNPKASQCLRLSTRWLKPLTSERVGMSLLWRWNSKRIRLGMPVNSLDLIYYHNVCTCLYQIYQYCLGQA